MLEQKLYKWWLLTIVFFSKTWSDGISPTPPQWLAVLLWNYGVLDYHIWMCILSGIYVWTKSVEMMTVTEQQNLVWCVDHNSSLKTCKIYGDVHIVRN